MAYRRNKNLRDMIGGNTIINNKTVIKQRRNAKLANANHALAVKVTYDANKFLPRQLSKAIKIEKYTIFYTIINNT